MSSPARTPGRRSKRGRADEMSSELDVPSPARSSRSGKSNTPKRTPRGSKAAASKDPLSSDLASPPSQRRRVDSSPGGDLAPMPSSPGTALPLFSSPGREKGTALPTSEIDLSSPLNYGTPSSRLGGVGTPHTPGIGGTPIRMRPDVRSERKMRVVNLTASSEAGQPAPANQMTSEIGSESAAEPNVVIWGTDVEIKVCKAKFTNFINQFVDHDLKEDKFVDGVNEPLYLQRLEEINIIGEPFLNLNAQHLQKFDEDLYRQLVQYPQEIIPTFDMAVNEMFFKRFPETALDHQIQVRPYSVDTTKNMRSLNPEDIDRLISINGMVIRMSSIIPEMCEALFKCNVCKNTVSVEVEQGRINEPTVCTNCSGHHTYMLIHNRSQFSDKQMIKLQEAPEDMPAGQTPHTVIVFAHGDLIDKVQAGDRINITGIYRATPLRVKAWQRGVKAVYKTHIDVIHFRKMDEKKLHQINDDDDVATLGMSEAVIENLKKLSEQPDIYLRLAQAIAPSIFENDYVKKGILMQLFGGCRKDFTKTGRAPWRAELNILLCGDPGTSKSQLLQYVHHLVPRGQYTSGKGSSAVGLTAYITKDPETRQLVLQTGALVLSDNGVCCIDEFDKMNESTRSVLHEVMEQQTLSIAKAGIICSLNARTSVLAAANPVESQWNSKKTIVENIQLPPTLLSRFDLIFLLLDPQDELYDRRLARHLVSLYYHSEVEKEDEALDMSILKDYLAYAKSTFNPKLSDQAGQQLITHYIEMRKLGSVGQITAYPRQLESLIRLSEAHAKMRFSHVVEVNDVNEAHRLHREALKCSAVDPSTGRIDMNILTTGISDSVRRDRSERALSILELIKTKTKDRVTMQKKTLLDLYRAKSERIITKDQLTDALKDLQDDGAIIVTGNHVRLCT